MNVPVVCNSDFVDCDKIIKWLSDFPISKNRLIFVEDSAKLIKRFDGDEEVEYDFTEGGFIAKTRDRESPCPQILVAPDIIWQKLPSEIDISDQIVLSTLHEEAHVEGIQNERKAEAWAYNMYRSFSKSFAPRLTRKK